MELGALVSFGSFCQTKITGVLTAWPILAKMCGVMQIRPTVAYGSSKALNQRDLGGPFTLILHKHTYLHEGFTVIIEAVTPGRGWSIALRIWLTPAISPNVGNSAWQFLLVGNCVRAIPWLLTWSYSCILVLSHLCTYLPTQSLGWARMEILSCTLYHQVSCWCAIERVWLERTLLLFVWVSASM